MTKNSQTADSEESTAAADAIAVLSRWDAPSSHSTLRDEYLSFLRQRGDAALDRDGGPAHLTASCFIFTPDLAHVLLCFHRKGQFWVQVGGHIDASDDDLAGAALREAREESGLNDLTVVDAVLDLDRHHLGAAFGRCQTHWDVGFVALALPAPPQVSDESERVAWFSVDALPPQMADSVPSRIENMLEQLMHQGPLC